MHNLSFKNVVADLFISNKCNLNCKHCYFGITRNILPQLTLNEWKNTIDVLYSVGVRHFHFSGKESSLCGDTTHIIAYIKERYKDVYLGLVSNGTGHVSYYTSLIDLSIDYLELSIDGLKNSHDFIRGGGVYDKVYSLVSKISNKKININIATCINKLNIFEYIELLQIFLSLGVTRFFLTPFVETGNGKHISNLSITSDDLTALVHDILSFINNPQNANKRISIKLCLTKEWTSKLWQESPTINKIIRNYFENNGSLIYRTNGNAFQISMTFFDIEYYTNISITNDGYIIPESDDISANNAYPLNSIGNIKDLDSSKLTQLRYNHILKQLTNEGF